MKKIMFAFVLLFVVFSSVCFAESKEKTEPSTAVIMDYNNRAMLLFVNDATEEEGRLAIVKIIQFEGLVAANDTVRGKWDTPVQQIFVDETANSRFSGQMLWRSSDSQMTFQVFELYKSGKM